MNNPFEVQMNRLRTSSSNEVNTDVDTNVNTQVSSPLFDRRKRDNKSNLTAKKSTKQYLI